jgi:hypothetical protein
MAEQRITLVQIRLLLENETRLTKKLEFLADIDELLALSEDDLFWEEIPGVFSSSQSTVDENNKVISSKQSIVMKLFANKETYEVRQFVAKFTDAPETRTLPG